MAIDEKERQEYLMSRRIVRVLARSLWYNFRMMLAYKSKLNGNLLVIADRAYPSTQTCSNCGNILKKESRLKLSQRTYICPICNYKEDRDINAAHNLNMYGINMARS